MKEKVMFVLLDFYFINNVNLPPESVNNTTKVTIRYAI